MLKRSAWAAALACAALLATYFLVREFGIGHEPVRVIAHQAAPPLSTAEGSDDRGHDPRPHTVAMQDSNTSKRQVTDVNKLYLDLHRSTNLRKSYLRAKETDLGFAYAIEIAQRCSGARLMDHPDVRQVIAQDESMAAKRKAALSSLLSRCEEFTDAELDGLETIYLSTVARRNEIYRTAWKLSSALTEEDRMAGIDMVVKSSDPLLMRNAVGSLLRPSNFGRTSDERGDARIRIPEIGDIELSFELRNGVVELVICEFAGTCGMQTLDDLIDCAGGMGCAETRRERILQGHDAGLQRDMLRVAAIVIEAIKNDSIRTLQILR